MISCVSKASTSKTPNTTSKKSTNNDRTTTTTTNAAGEKVTTSQLTFKTPAGMTTEQIINHGGEYIHQQNVKK